MSSYTHVLTVIGMSATDRLNTLDTPVNKTDPTPVVRIVSCATCIPKQRFVIGETIAGDPTSFTVTKSNDSRLKPAEMYVLGFSSAEDAELWVENRKEKLASKIVYLDLAAS